MTKGVTRPPITGVNTCAGSWATAIVPCVTIWDRRAVFCGVNQPTGRLATWSPRRWRAVCSTVVPTRTPACSTRRRQAQQAITPASSTASQRAAPPRSPASSRESSGASAVMVRPQSSPWATAIQA